MNLKCKLFVLMLALLLPTSVAFADNSLAVTNSAAIEGSFGLEVILGDSSTADAAYLVSNHMTDETGIRLSLLFAPGSLDMSPVAGQNNTRVIRIFQDFNPGGTKVVLFLKRSNDDVSWRLACYVSQDTTGFVFGGEGFLHLDSFTGATRIDFEWGAASAPGANDGFVRAFRTRTEGNTNTFTIFNRTDLDNDTHRLNTLHMGMINPGTGHFPGTMGTYYLDSFVLSRL